MKFDKINSINEILFNLFDLKKIIYLILFRLKEMLYIYINRMSQQIKNNLTEEQIENDFFTEEEQPPQPQRNYLTDLKLRLKKKSREYIDLYIYAKQRINNMTGIIARNKLNTLIRNAKKNMINFIKYEKQIYRFHKKSKEDNIKRYEQMDIVSELNKKNGMDQKENRDEITKIYNEILKQKEECEQIIRGKDSDQRIIINKALVKQMWAHRRAMK